MDPGRFTFGFDLNVAQFEEEQHAEDGRYGEDEDDLGDFFGAEHEDRHDPENDVDQVQREDGGALFAT
jgi:hypothetical protein